MKNITRLWTQLADSLAEITTNQSFMTELYDKFGEIFDLKDANEYKVAASVSDVITPKQFVLTNEKNTFNINDYPNIPRCSVSDGTSN